MRKILFCFFLSPTVAWAETSSDTNTWNICAFPEENCDVVGKLKKGVDVQTKKESGQWALIEILEKQKSVKGWILKDDLAKFRGEHETQAKASAADPSRVFYSYTAIPREKGTFSAKGHYFGVWNLEYSVSDEVTVAGSTLLPVGLFGIGGGARIAKGFSENVYAGIF